MGAVLPFIHSAGFGRVMEFELALHELNELLNISLNLKWDL